MVANSQYGVDNPPFPSLGGWYTIQTTTISAATTSGKLVQVTPAANVTITAPAAASGAYFGVQLCGSTGFKITVQKPDTTLIYELTVDSETVWFSWDNVNGVWRQSAVWNAAPNFGVRFASTCLAAWLSSGADANLTDLTGNGRTFVKNVTIRKAVGMPGQVGSSGYLSQYLLTDAALRLSAAMSYEFIACPIYLGVNNGGFIQCGSGAGGATNNTLWCLRWLADTDTVTRWAFRQQNNANVNSDLLAAQVTQGWVHIGATRASDGTTVKMYANGELLASATLTAVTSGTAAQMIWGGTATNQAAGAQQFGAVYDSELSAQQMRYLAHLRMGKTFKAA